MAAAPDNSQSVRASRQRHPKWLVGVVANVRRSVSGAGCRRRGQAHESGDDMVYRLGVDMGTTFTAAAVANGMSPTLVGLGNRALQIPSVLFLTDEGSFLVGEAAEHRALAEPERVVREFKRRI